MRTQQRWRECVVERLLLFITILIITPVSYSLAIADEKNWSNPTLSISLQQDKYGALESVQITILNDQDEVMCVSYNYNANTRITIYRDAQVVPQTNRFEGRPRPGCIELEVGASLNVTYSLGALYRDVSLRDTRTCYVLPWRFGKYSEGRQEYRSRVCAEIVSQDVDAQGR